MELASAQRYREAMDALSHALRHTQKTDNRLLHHLALVYAWSGEYNAALAQLDRGLAADRNNPELIASRAEILSWKGDIAAATSAYENLVRISPNNGGYWLKLAQMYALQGRSSEARAGYAKVLHLAPDNIDAYIGVADIYRENHQYNSAEQLLRGGLSKFPGDARLTNELAVVAASKSLSVKNWVMLIELVVFAAVLVVIAHDIRHDRRVLRRRHLTGFVLLPAALSLALLMAVVYVNILFGGSYYKPLSTATQLLEPLLIGALLTLTLFWRLRFERPQRQKTILAIGAHPDDIEFGCGATLLRQREEGAVTYGLVLTGGERGHDTTEQGKIRTEEACSAARVLALCDVKVHNFPDTKLHEHKAEIRKVIEEAVTRWRPDIIFTHNGHDVHTDHQTVFDATREAARGAFTILCYENPNTPPGFKPGYFFDVGNYLDGKIKALECHKTQMGKSYAASSVVRAIAGFRGTQARVPLAEGFEVMRVLVKERNQ